MADRVLAWAKKQKEDLERIISLYESGAVQMTEHRDGKSVPVTAEYLVRARQNLVELNDLLGKT